MRRYVRLFIVAIIVGGLLPVVSVSPVLGADAVVSGACTEVELAAAVATVDGSGGGTVTFDCGVVTIPITSELVITGDVTIDGASQVTLDAQGLDRHFFVQSGATLELDGMILLNGNQLTEEASTSMAGRSSCGNPQCAQTRLNLTEERYTIMAVH